MKFVKTWFDLHPAEYARMLAITRKSEPIVSGRRVGHLSTSRPLQDVNDVGNVSNGAKTSSKSEASLRMLDWFVTNFARRHKIAYLYIDPVTTEKRIFNVFVEYKTALDYYHKDLFDPFRRSCHETGNSDTTEFMSTLRQLNFFRWAFTYNVIDYVAEHAVDIEKDMMELRMRPRDRKSVTPADKGSSRDSPTATARTKVMHKGTRRNTGPPVIHNRVTYVRMLYNPDNPPAVAGTKRQRSSMESDQAPFAIERPFVQRFRKTQFAPVISDQSENLKFKLNQPE
jgi:hypothetical protein